MGRAFLTHRALSTDLKRRDTDARGDGISRSFVHKNSSLRFVNIFSTVFCIHFTRTVIARHRDAHISLISDISVSRNSTASRKKKKNKETTFQQTVFHRSWNFREQSNPNSSTRTQIHGYILQVVNFYRFYYHSFFFKLIINLFNLSIPY